jgi:hypothetical protein
MVRQIEVKIEKTENPAEISVPLDITSSRIFSSHLDIKLSEIATDRY